MHLSFFSTRLTKQLKACIKYFKALNQLQIVVFSCYIRRNYPAKSHFYEQEIHEHRLKLLIAMQKMRTVAAQDTQNNLGKLENLYEIIFSLNTLKLRITDHTTFEICETEFKTISRSLSDALQHVIIFLNWQCDQPKKISLENVSDPKASALLDGAAKVIGSLSNKIDALDELYRNTLQVTSADPIFFLFFIQDLMALRDELESFFLGLLNG